MPQLLRDVLCVIDTFHKYAREDSKEATLTYRELKQLIQGEFGDILQSNVIHAVERNLNLLNTDSDGTISFDEFVLTIFNLLNRCYLNIQSLLNSEAGQVSKPEMPNDVDLQASKGLSRQTEGMPTNKGKIVFPSETAFSVQLSPKEREAVGHNSVNPQGDTKTCKQLEEASGYNDPKNQHLERNEQRQKDTSTGDSGAQFKTNKPRERSGQTGSTIKQEKQNKKMFREGDKPTREQSGTEKREQFGEKERNLGRQSSTGEIVQRPSKDEQAKAEQGGNGHFKTQELPGKAEPSSEHGDSSEQTAAQKLHLQKSKDTKDENGTAETQEAGKDANMTPPETKGSADPEHEDKASESQETPAQEKKQDLIAHQDSREVPEIPNVRAEGKEGKGVEDHVTGGQEESERKIQPPALEDQTQDEEYHEPQESQKGKGVKKGSKTQELYSGGEKDHSDIEEAAIPRIKAKHAEENTADTPVSSKGTPEAEETPGAKEQKQELATHENQSKGENKKATNTCDKLNDGDGNQGHNSGPTVTQNDEASLKNSNSLTLAEGDSTSEISEFPGQEDSQSQATLLRETVPGSQNNNPDTQEQVSPSEENRSQEVVVPVVRGEKEQLLEEEKKLAGGEQQDSGTKGPDPAEEPSEHLETQESTDGGKHTTSLETAVPAMQVADLTEQLPEIYLPAKEKCRKEEDAAVPETQEAQVQSLEEDSAASPETHLKAKETTIAAQEDKRPLKLVGEGDDQINSAKKGHDSLVPQPDLKDQEPHSVERSKIYSNPLYTYLQEKILQQADMTQEQAQAVRASSPELCDDLSSESLTSNSPVLQQSTRELHPDEEPADVQQTSLLQVLGNEKDGLQSKEPEPQKEASTTKQ